MWRGGQAALGPELGPCPRPILQSPCPALPHPRICPSQPPGPLCLAPNPACTSANKPLTCLPRVTSVARLLSAGGHGPSPGAGCSESPPVSETPGGVGTVCPVRRPPREGPSSSMVSSSAITRLPAGGLGPVSPCPRHFRLHFRWALKHPSLPWGDAGWKPPPQASHTVLPQGQASPDCPAPPAHLCVDRCVCLGV